jgi:hypothetical protein
MVIPTGGTMAHARSIPVHQRVLALTVACAALQGCLCNPSPKARVTIAGDTSVLSDIVATNGLTVMFGDTVVCAFFRER